MKSHLFIVFLFLLCFGRINALFFGKNKGGCRRDPCLPPPEPCQEEIIYDPCGCQQCSQLPQPPPLPPPIPKRGEGEKCGTTLYPENECAAGLVCMTPVHITMCRYSRKALSGYCVRLNTPDSSVSWKKESP